MVKTGDDGSSFVVLGLKHFFNNMASVAYTGNLVPSGREDSDGVADAEIEEDDLMEETAFDELLLLPLIFLSGFRVLLVFWFFGRVFTGFFVFLSGFRV